MDASSDRSAARLPMFAAAHEVLAALALIWAGLLIGFFLNESSEHEWAFAVGVYLSVTTVMLWPVGRRLGYPYLSYRRPLFIVGVAGMGGLPLLLWVIMAHWSELVVYLVLYAVVLELGVTALLASLPPAIGRPLPMFFRPELIFGEGRTLVAGIIATAVGVRTIFWEPTPMLDFGVPVPSGHWMALFFTIVLGIIPLIPVRGVVKLRHRLGRMAMGRWTHPVWTYLREALLVAGAVFTIYGFHTIFGGLNPFVDLGQSLEGDVAGELLMLAAAIGLIAARGSYKLWIGDPFTRETPRQAVIRQSMLALGIVALALGFLWTALGDFPAFGSGWALGAGIPLLAFGVLLLLPGRVVVQRLQGRAVMQQMTTTILPRLDPDRRRRVVRQLLVAVAESPPRHGHRLARMMMELTGEMPSEAREGFARQRDEAMGELRQGQRERLAKAMEAAGQAGVETRSSHRHAGTTQA